MREIQPVPIAKFVEDLQSVPEPEFTRETVLGRMRGLLFDRSSLEPYRHFIPDHYTRNLVFRNDLFEVLVLCWGSGHVTPVHNHDNQLGWLTVQEGLLSLQNFQRVSCARGGPGEDPSRCIAGSDAPVMLAEVAQMDIAGVGAVSTTDRQETIHRIANQPNFGAKALSVHIYSQPIDSCVVYDLENRSCKRIPLSYHSEHGKVVART